MQYIDALLFSSLLLLTIPTTGFISWFLSIEGIPDKYTVIGGCVILIGIALITYSEHYRGKVSQQVLDSTSESDIQLSELKKMETPSSPLSIASALQISSPLQYSQLQQVDADDEEGQQH
jgi:hypothetical protein